MGKLTAMEALTAVVIIVLFFVVVGLFDWAYRRISGKQLKADIIHPTLSAWWAKLRAWWTEPKTTIGRIWRVVSSMWVAFWVLLFFLGPPAAIIISGGTEHLGQSALAVVAYIAIVGLFFGVLFSLRPQARANIKKTAVAALWAAAIVVVLMLIWPSTVSEHWNALTVRGRYFGVAAAVGLFMFNREGLSGTVLALVAGYLVALGVSTPF